MGWIWRRQSLVRLFLIASVSLGLVFLLGKLQLEGNELLLALRRFSLRDLLLSLGLVLLVQIPFQMMRLWVLCPKKPPVSWWHAAQAFITGQFVGNLFMSQAGHGVKIALLRKERDRRGRRIDSAESTAIILADKIVDVGNLFLLTFLSALQVSVALPQVNWLEKGGIVLVGIPLLLVGNWAVLRLLRRRSPRLRRWMNNLQVSLRKISNPLQIRNGVAMDLGDWLTECLVLQILCVAQGYPLNPAQLMISLFVLNIGISAPISIANLGTFEASLALALKAMGIPLPQGIVIATVFHLLQIVGISLWMLVNSLNLWSGLPFAQVKTVNLDPLQNNCSIDKVASK